MVEDLGGHELAAVPRAERSEEGEGRAVERLFVHVVLGELLADASAVLRDLRLVEPVRRVAVRAGLVGAVEVVRRRVVVALPRRRRREVLGEEVRGVERIEDAGRDREGARVDDPVVDRAPVRVVPVLPGVKQIDGGVRDRVGRGPGEERGRERVLPAVVPAARSMRGRVALDVGDAVARCGHELDERAHAPRRDLVLVEEDRLPWLARIAEPRDRERAATRLVDLAGLAELARAAGAPAVDRRQLGPVRHFLSAPHALLVQSLSTRQPFSQSHGGDIVPPQSTSV